jgi:hypothetical protein
MIVDLAVGGVPMIVRASTVAKLAIFQQNALNQEAVVVAVAVEKKDTRVSAVVEVVEVGVRMWNATTAKALVTCLVTALSQIIAVAEVGVEVVVKTWNATTATALVTCLATALNQTAGMVVGNSATVSHAERTTATQNKPLPLCLCPRSLVFVFYDDKLHLHLSLLL